MIGIKKHKEEAVNLLSEFVPKARKFSAKVNSYKDYIEELEERLSIQKENNSQLRNENKQLKDTIIDKEYETGLKLNRMQNQVEKYEKYIKKISKNIIDEIDKKEKEHNYYKDREMEI